MRASSQGPPPLDRTKVDAVCSIEADDLSLMSLPKLQALRDEIDQLTEEASGALTHALLMREKETGDTETYNNMIQVRRSRTAPLERGVTGLDANL